MTQEELEIRQRLKDDFEHYASRCLFIRTKDSAIKSLRFNHAQVYVNNLLEKQLKETGRVRAIILKGRQQGMSTLVEGRFYWKVSHRFGVRAFILTHDKEATNNLFDMVQRYHNNCPELVRPRAGTSNAKELLFDALDSGYKVGTAGNKGVGRSSTIQYFHGSEVAFWPNAAEHAKGIMQAVPLDGGSEIILESTAFGVGNYFHSQWEKAISGESDFLPIFVPWFWQPEYSVPVSEMFALDDYETEIRDLYGLTNEQMLWRRKKIQDLSINGLNADKSFKQEYPCVVHSQRVGTDIGLIPIKEVVNDSNTNQGRVIDVWSSGIKPTVRIETALGYSLECTLDHRIKLSHDGFVEASKSSGSVIKLGIPKFSENLHCFTWQSFPCINNNLVINEEFALFLGFYMGDGSYYGDTLSIVFDKRDEDSIKLAEDLIYKLFGRKLQKRQVSTNGIELRGSIKQLKDIFLRIGAVKNYNGQTKRNICIPDVIWKSPKNIIKQFLRGLFDADGFAGHRLAKVSFFSKSLSFIKDVQLLLLGFGITCKRNHVIKKSGSGHLYMGNELILRASEARKFGDEIGFVSNRKNKRIMEWSQTKLGRTAFKIELIDKVTKIESLGEQEVYDLEISNNLHVFDANGIIVHNCNAEEAFQVSGVDPLIPTEYVVRAMKNTVDGIGPKVMGVDPAWTGTDRTSIVLRQGRKVYGLESIAHNPDIMVLTGKLHTLIKKEKPDAVFIDVTGGLGAGIVDRLKEMGNNQVRGVNSSQSPINDTHYANKRAEMWCEMKKWLIEEIVELPKIDSLHKDLCGVTATPNSRGKTLLESKESMTKRGLRSPDEGDALALTFAFPVRYNHDIIGNIYNPNIRI